MPKNIDLWLNLEIKDPVRLGANVPDYCADNIKLINTTTPLHAQHIPIMLKFGILQYYLSVVYMRCSNRNSTGIMYLHGNFKYSD